MSVSGCGKPCATHWSPPLQSPCNLQLSPAPARLTLGLVRPPALLWRVVTQRPDKTGTLTPRHTPPHLSPFPLFFLPLASPSLNC